MVKHYAECQGEMDHESGPEVDIDGASNIVDVDLEGVRDSPRREKPISPVKPPKEVCRELLGLHS